MPCLNAVSSYNRVTVGRGYMLSFCGLNNSDHNHWLFCTPLLERKTSEGSLLEKRMMNEGLTGLHLPGLGLTLRGLISLRKSLSSCPDLSEIENYSPSASTGRWNGPAAALSAGPDQCILRGDRGTLCCVTKGSMLPTVPGSVRCSRRSSCVPLLWDHLWSEVGEITWICFNLETFQEAFVSGISQ